MRSRMRATETVGQLKLLQPRTRTLDGTLHDLFTPLYPTMPANNVQPAPFCCRSPSCPTVSGALYSERWDHGEIISLRRITVDLVVSRRFAKKQQIQWSKRGPRLLQTRTRTLDGTLHDLFTTWYPAMPANDVQPAPLAAAA